MASRDSPIPTIVAAVMPSLGVKTQGTLAQHASGLNLKEGNEVGSREAPFFEREAERKRIPDESKSSLDILLSSWYPHHR
jgi:hypothetical protein